MDPLLANIRLDILMSMRSTLTTAWRDTDVHDPFSRLYLVETGTGYMTHSGRTYRLRPGQNYVVPAYRPLEYGSDGGLIISWIHFNSSILHGVDLFSWLDCELEVKTRPGDLGCHRRLRAALKRGTAEGQFECMAALYRLLAPFIATAEDNAPELHQQRLLRFEPVLEYIDNHLNETISIATLATLVHLETTYFSSLFKQTFGVPPLRYLHHKRVEKALRLLHETDCTLDEIAARLGYSDGFHFSRTVKRITGISPRTLRHKRQRRP